MKSMKQWAKSIFLWLHLRDQLLLLFLICGVIPIVIANLMTYRSSRDTLINQAAEDEWKALGIMQDSMMDSITLVSQLSRQLYFQEELEHIAFTSYSSYADILQDYRNEHVISEYQELYYREVLHITLYLDNKTISRNEHFVYADAQIQSEDWYQQALALKGLPYWSWSLDAYSRKNCLRLSRMLYTRDRQKVGVLSIILQNKRTELPVQGRNKLTMLLWQDGTVLHHNQDMGDADPLPLLSLTEGTSTAIWQGQRCLATVVKISPEYSDAPYTLLSLIPYNDLLREARLTALKSLIPQFLCVAAALVLILLFSRAFDTRIRRFHDEMHRAATGDFQLSDSVEGQDEIADLQRDLHVMVQDIQHLTARIIEENTAKEKLHARQKDSEIKMLTSQINPHFLFNTLETIRMQAVIKGQKEIAELAKMLARILRRSISSPSALQSIHVEMQLVKDYLKIQDYRFHDRMRYEIVEDTAISNWQIMPLLIQPLVENAMLHGLKDKLEGGLICVHSSVEDDMLCITVSDNGQGIDEESLAALQASLNDPETEQTDHIGLRNVNQRIRLQYGAPYGLQIQSTPGLGTSVMLRLPHIENREGL